MSRAPSGVDEEEESKEGDERRRRIEEWRRGEERRRAEERRKGGEEEKRREEERRSREEERRSGDHVTFTHRRTATGSNTWLSVLLKDTSIGRGLNRQPPGLKTGLLTSGLPCS